ncbi:FxsB family cyclophane-forming radical SAM/SPASM peptide maturase [Streptomyces odontomachi]|uniref:FxsB family cyclophane-forming radical SAM/SPASM peptide maturase n=1 Tax=Streptomyces odontomachi TaxID=2944940 RepID=UPI00210AB199|nr:FxsB family cyclophane-forming radical SAM/SPASM peptide maturase [Streptomyces sp. ODS25]
MGVETMQSSGLEWPMTGLDVPALKATGWRPVPFNQFVLKVHSRCNLACDYCYMYEMSDQSWRGRPAVMSPDLIRVTASRMGDYARRHRLPAAQVVLHGGEPLLAGSDVIAFLAEETRRAFPAETRLAIGVHTNGALLTEEMLETLRAHDIRVGISLDGDKGANDRHRRYRNGRSSYDDVVQGLALLRSPRYAHLFSSILAVIDLANDPIETYEGIAGFEPPAMDFLLPHANWMEPPPGKAEPGSTPYADWLIKVFDHWYDRGSSRANVRLFAGAMKLLLGRPGDTEQIGLQPANFLVVETDGTIEQVDTLKSAFAGAPETGSHIADCDFDTVAEHPGVVARQIGVEALCEQCRGCQYRDVCGGGLYVHRYRAGTGFRNPSVYCEDLMKFVGHAKGRLMRDLDRVRRARG